MTPRERLQAPIEAAIEDAWTDAIKHGRPADADGLLVLHDFLVRCAAEARNVSLLNREVEAILDTAGVPFAIRQLIYHVRNASTAREQIAAARRNPGSVH